MLQKEGTLRRQKYKLVARALWWSCHLWLDFVSWSYGYHFRRQIDAITIIKRLKGNRSIKMTLTQQNVMHDYIYPININTKNVTKKYSSSISQAICVPILKQVLNDHYCFSCFIAHLSWKLKWAFLITSRPSVCL